MSPTMRYARLLAHGYEIGSAPSTTIASGTAVHTPITLCQLKSRALAQGRDRNQSTFLNWIHVQTRHPQVHAADDDEQEDQIGGAGQCLAGGAARSLERQVAMPRGHRPEERCEAAATARQ